MKLLLSNITVSTKSGLDVFGKHLDIFSQRNNKIMSRKRLHLLMKKKKRLIHKFLPKIIILPCFLVFSELVQSILRHIDKYQTHFGGFVQTESFLSF